MFWCIAVSSDGIYYRLAGVKGWDLLGIRCICKDCNNRSKNHEIDWVLNPRLRARERQMRSAWDVEVCHILTYS
jgi:hypothetical protein